MRLVDIYGKLWKPLGKSGYLPHQGFKNPFPLSNNDTAIGIEVEAEGFAGFAVDRDTLDRITLVWPSKPENSLRDRGVEFITFPIKGVDVGYALHLLVCMNKSGKLRYTDLAGLHVHLNVRGWTVDMFKNLAMIYLVFEDSLYRISGQRQRSIYCLPARISWSGLPYLMETSDLPEAVRLANKYMGFNYKTIKNFGTVEFRHSKGTPDVSYIHHWINTLLRMHTAAEQFQSVELKERIFQLNTNSSYQQFANDIFKEDVDWISCPDLSTEMSEGVSILKEWSIMPHINSTKILDTVVKPQKKAVLASSTNAVVNWKEVAARMQWHGDAPIVAVDPQFVGMRVDNNVIPNVAVPPLPKVEAYRDDDGVMKLRYVP